MAFFLNTEETENHTAYTEIDNLFSEPSVK